MERARQSAGSPFPRGATWDGRGVNFSLFSAASESVELCLFDQGARETDRIRIRERTNGVWHLRPTAWARASSTVTAFTDAITPSRG